MVEQLIAKSEVVTHGAAETSDADINELCRHALRCSIGLDLAHDLCDVLGEVSLQLDAPLSAKTPTQRRAMANALMSQLRTAAAFVERERQMSEGLAHFDLEIGDCLADASHNAASMRKHAVAR